MERSVEIMQELEELKKENFKNIKRIKILKKKISKLKTKASLGGHVNELEYKTIKEEIGSLKSKEIKIQERTKELFNEL